MNEKYNVIVIGSGPAGYSAAIRAAQMGASVALIEKDKLGGTCLNRGCIPTKFIWESLRMHKKIKRASDYGIETELKNFNFAAVQQKKKKNIDLMAKNLSRLISSYSIKIVEGTAKFLSSNLIEVLSSDGRSVKLNAEKIIIAAGSKSRNLTKFTINHQKYIDSNDALNFQEIPDNILIIGAGAIGIELAGIFSSFGSEVKLVEKEPQILPGEDAELAAEIKKNLERGGVKIETNVDSFDNLVQGFFKVLIATGRESNILDLDIDKAGIKYNNKGIIVNEYFETSVPGIYSAGDNISNSVYLAYCAQAEGIAAAENAMGHKNKTEYSIIPKVVFSYPQAASVGLREKDISIDKINIGRYSFSNNSRSAIENERSGWIKIISDKTSGVILGAQIIGPSAEDMITFLSLSIKKGVSVHDMKRELFFHPALSEVIYTACEDSLGKCVDSPKK